ncbi:MAG TPA: 5-(carboxyamino)imidazole ribonucleotide synthase [Pseudobdellovibrionaceae bacterium]|nr:5-(carboxyamino)imidazole ribonucleotide synthase [Pseudobdellovibrionaceae bacterium]
MPNRLGILGGGQLARMMALEAHRLGIEVAVCSESPHDPAAQVVRHHHAGKLNDESTLKAFFDSCDSITFESEFLDADLIGRLSQNQGTPVFPAPSLMGKIQDRLTQKQLLEEHDLPTSPWRAVDNSHDAIAAWVGHKNRSVFKKRRFGYDGYGTYIVKSSEDFDHLIKSVPGPQLNLIAEQYVNFDRELALVLARDLRGNVFCYPYVETRQKDSRCLWVKGPIPNSRRMLKLREQIAEFANQINYVGVMGVELFETERGLLINELAPRVHNTGHHSLNSFTVSQFALHVQAASGLEIDLPQPIMKGFAMWNLLGTRDQVESSDPDTQLYPERASTAVPPRADTGSAFFHWYGKSQTRRGRKMGHVNTVSRDADLALELAKRMGQKILRDVNI